MNEKDLRKQLTVMVYSFIFKRILPTMDGVYKIGNIEYANSLNQLLKRRISGDFTDTVFSDFDLITTPKSLDIVKESNFNNWVNGTSNPKSFDIINALLEYVYESTQSPAKELQLKHELLAVIDHTSFSEYNNHLIDSIIEQWSLRLKSDIETVELFRIFKDVLYLLKDKNRHLSFLLHQKQEQILFEVDVPSTVNMDVSDDTVYDTVLENEHLLPIVENQINDEENTEKPKQASNGLFQDIAHFYRSHKKVSLFVSISLLCFVLFLGLNTIHNLSKVNSEVIIETTDLTAEEKPENLNDSDTSAQIVSEPEVTMNTVSSRPTDDDLVPPTVTYPTSGSLLTYEPVTIQWDKVDIADAYDVSLVNVITGEIVYDVKNIRDLSAIIDTKYFYHDTEYTIYVIAKKDSSSSEATVIPIRFEAIEAPKLLAPQDHSIIDLSDVTVTWKQEQGAATYKIVVTDLTRWVNVYEKAYIDSTSCILDQSLFVPGNKYRIYVSSQNTASESKPNYLDIEFNPLAAPVVISSVNLSLLSTGGTTVQWNPVPFAGSYKIDIMETNTWEKVLSKDGILDTSFNLDASLFKIGGTYRIYLFATLAKASSEPAYIDITAPELSAPVIKQPANNTTLPLADLTINWDAYPYSQFYTVVVMDTIAWEPVITYEKVLETSVTLDKTLLKINGTYRIYVKSNAGDLVSAPNYVDIQIEGIKKPDILTPKMNTVFDDQTITIQWAPITYITTYKVTITDLSTWEQIYSDPGLMAESFTVDKGLLKKGGSYRVYIQAIVGDTESEPSILDFSLK